MKKIIYIILTLLSTANFISAQIIFCNDSLPKEDLINRKVKIYCLSPRTESIIKELFDSTLTSKFTSDYKDLYSKYNGKIGEIIDVSIPINYQGLKRIFAIKIDSIYLPLDCSSICDTNDLDINECRVKYDSIYKPYNKKCFFKNTQLFLGR